MRLQKTLVAALTLIQVIAFQSALHASSPHYSMNSHIPPQSLQAGAVLSFFISVGKLPAGTHIDVVANPRPIGPVSLDSASGAFTFSSDKSANLLALLPHVGRTQTGARDGYGHSALQTIGTPRPRTQSRLSCLAIVDVTSRLRSMTSGQNLKSPVQQLTSGLAASRLGYNFRGIDFPCGLLHAVGQKAHKGNSSPKEKN